MRYLAEFYLPDSGSELAEVARRAEDGARRAAGREAGRGAGLGAERGVERGVEPGSAVSFLSAIYLAEDESCLAIYEAGSAELVRAAGVLAGLDFDHVAEIRVCDADPADPADPGEISA